MKKAELVKKLKPYWKDFWKINSRYWEETRKLEDKMNKELKLGTELEFFHVDGECVGIGASNYDKRGGKLIVKNGKIMRMPLIHDTVLYDKK